MSHGCFQLCCTQVLFDHASAAVSDCAVSLDRVFIRLEAIATIKTIDPCKHYIGIKYLFL